MPLSLALAVREIVAGHRLGALERGGGVPLPFQFTPAHGDAVEGGPLRQAGEDVPVCNWSLSLGWGPGIQPPPPDPSPTPKGIFDNRSLFCCTAAKPPHEPDQPPFQNRRSFSLWASSLKDCPAVLCLALCPSQTPGGSSCRHKKGHFRAFLRSVCYPPPPLCSHGSLMRPSILCLRRCVRKERGIMTKHAQG